MAPPALKLDPSASLRIALASYLSALDRRPIATKSCTSGALYLVSELVSSAVATRALPASERARLNAEKAAAGGGKEGGKGLLEVVKRYQQALKLAGYGFFVAAPLDHFLYLLLERAFAKGPPSRTTRVLEIVASNTLILPIQNAVYLAVLSVLGGARSVGRVWGEVRASFLEVMRLTVVTSTLALVFAQRFLPPYIWTPFFSLCAATVDTLINVQEKKKAAVEERKRRAKEEAEAQLGGYEVDVPQGEGEK